MNPLIRLRTLLDRLSGTLWLLPTTAVLLAVVVATALVERAGDTVVPESLLFAGDMSAARGLMQVLAGSTITVTGLIFTLTVVALQIASSQYSPRLVSSFLRDRGNKVVMGLFLGSFAYALAVLRSLPAGDVVVPRVAITVGMVLALASVLSLVYFINNLAQSIRVETILADARRSVMSSIDNALPHPARPNAPERVAPVAPDHAVAITGSASGYVQSLSLPQLAKAAAGADAVVRLRAGVGDPVAEGGTLAWAWGSSEALSPEAAEALGEAVNAAVEIGEDRLLRQDVAFGLRQIVDVAAKALSPGINDPTTAVDALSYLTQPMIALAARHIALRQESGDDGVIRVSAPTPSFDDYLEMACGQPRRYGAAEPVVLAAIARLLLDIRASTTLDLRRQSVDTQIEVLVGCARRGIEQPHDLRLFEDVLATLRTEQEGAVTATPVRLA